MKIRPQGRICKEKSDKNDRESKAGGLEDRQICSAYEYVYPILSRSLSLKPASNILRAQKLCYLYLNMFNTPFL